MRKQIFSCSLAAAMAVSLMACSSGQTEGTSAAESTTAEATTAAETAGTEEAKETTKSGVSGTFSGSSAGMQGTVSVDLTVENGVITDVTVTENHETPSLTAVVFERIPAQIVEHQTTKLDAVTGATFASNALMRAASEAAQAAGLDMAALDANEYHAQAGQDETWDTDILVVGGGGAGLSAAITAAQEGSNVILVEKSSFLGGNTMMAGGGYNTVDPEAQAGMILTPAQKNTMDGYLALDPADPALKLDEFPEWKEVLTTLQSEIKAFYAANEGKEPGVDMPGFDSNTLHMWHIYVGGLRELNDGTWVASDIDMARTLAENSLDAFKWMDTIGIDAKTGADASDTVFTVLGAMWPRTHAVSADKPLIDALEKAAKDAGVTIYTETAAVSLTTDDSGKVVGAQAQKADGTKITVNTSKGVILASGGYCANAPMVKEYDKYWGDNLSDHTLTTNVGTNTGDGILMATEVGADVTGMEIAQMMPSSSPLKGTLSDGIWGDASEQIWIDGNGKRFVNEYAERDVLTKASLALDNGVFYIIYAGHGDDDGVCKGAAMEDTCFGKDVKTMWETNQIWYGATLAEAAEATKEAIGGNAPAFTEEQLREVIETYNGYVKAQKDDDFGKEVISGSIDLEAVDANPDLGICITPRKASLHHTMGGIVIDTDASVLDTDGKAIAGLWAAGEVTGGIHAGNRLGGNAEADVFTFGRIAGHSAAAAE